MKILSPWTLPKLRTGIIQAIQWVVVYTSFPPFSWFYSFYYQLTAWCAVSMLKLFPEVKAVYLTGSMAAGEIIYGLSDIDLLVFVDENDQRVRKWYKTFSRFFPLVRGKEISVYSHYDLPNILENDLHLKYKFSDSMGKAKLAYGEALVKPPAEPKDLDDALRGRLAFLWRFVIRDVILNQWHFEQRHRYLCRKTMHYMQKDPNPLTGISAIKPDPNLQAYTYLWCHEKIREYACSHRIKAGGNAVISQKLVAAKPVINQHNREKIEKICSFINSRFIEQISSVLLSPISVLPLDEEDIGLFLVQRKPLSIDEVKLLNETAGYWTGKQKFSLYLTTSDAAVGTNRYDEHPRTIIWPHDSPLTFLNLSSAEAVIRGEPLHTDKPALFSLLDARLKTSVPGKDADLFKLKEYLYHPNTARLPVIDLHLLFWQILQEVSLRKYETLHQSSSTLSLEWSERTGLEWIKVLGEEFVRDLDGTDSKTEILYQPAINFMKQLCLQHGTRSTEVVFS